MGDAGQRFQSIQSQKIGNTFSHERIRKNPFFEGRAEEFLNQVLSDLQVELYTDGKIIIQQGEHGEKMYFLERGEVDVLVGPEQVKVATLKEGAIFGEMAMFAGVGSLAKRTATIRACGFCDCRVIHHRAFHRILQKFPKERAFFFKMAEERRAALGEVKKESEDPADKASHTRRRWHADRNGDKEKEGTPPDEVSRARRLSLQLPQVAKSGDRQKRSSSLKPLSEKEDSQRHRAHSPMPSRTISPMPLRSPRSLSPMPVAANFEMRQQHQASMMALRLAGRKAVPELPPVRARIDDLEETSQQQPNTRRSLPNIKLQVHSPPLERPPSTQSNQWDSSATDRDVSADSLDEAPVMGKTLSVTKAALDCIAVAAAHYVPSKPAGQAPAHGPRTGRKVVRLADDKGADFSSASTSSPQSISGHESKATSSTAETPRRRYSSPGLSVSAKVAGPSPYAQSQVQSHRGHDACAAGKLSICPRISRSLSPIPSREHAGVAFARGRRGLDHESP